MRLSRTLVTLGAAGLTLAGYTLDSHFDHTNFFSEFNFFVGKDPNNGNALYLDREQANAQKLAGYANVNSQKTVFLGTDYTTKNPPDDMRWSTRVASKKAWTHMLLIADVAHMPGSTCGNWPAMWLLGSGDWPLNGEIDFMENVNSASQNLMTLHTTDGCTMNGVSCLGYKNKGCPINGNAPNMYGTNFNNAGGGVYAVDWNSDHIHIYFFPRSSIPADIAAGKSPDPKSWGTPAASFEGGSGCNIDQHFKNHSIVVNTELCGSWAGGAFSQDPVCASFGSCASYVASNPDAFTESYWAINYISVYTPSGGSGSGGGGGAAAPNPAVAGGGKPANTANTAVFPSTSTAATAATKHAHAPYAAPRSWRRRASKK